MNRLFILSAAPLATALSYSPERVEHSGKAVVGRQVESPARRADELAVSREGAREIDKTWARAELLQRGLQSGAAEKIIEQANLVNQLDPRGYRWQKGQRLTGMLLVPDSAAVVCGYFNQPIWFFRSQMHEARNNLDCSARIHLSSNRSSRWAAMLSRPDAL